MSDSYIGTLVDTLPNTYYTQPHEGGGAGIADNLVVNGSFENVDLTLPAAGENPALIMGWNVNAPTVMERDVVAPITDTASIKVTTQGEFGGEGVQAVVGALPTGFDANIWGLRLTFTIKGLGDFLVYLECTGGTDIDRAWEGSSTLTPATHVVDIVVPPGGVTAITVDWYTDWDIAQATSFWLDDVSLVPFVLP